MQGGTEGETDARSFAALRMTSVVHDSFSVTRVPQSVRGSGAEGWRDKPAATMSESQSGMQGGTEAAATAGPSPPSAKDAAGFGMTAEVADGATGESTSCNWLVEWQSGVEPSHSEKGARLSTVMGSELASDSRRRMLVTMTRLGGSFQWPSELRQAA